MEHLREQVMINQFVQVTGSSREQAEQILSNCSWQLQTALSIHFEECQVVGVQGLKPPNLQQLLTPSNTPATPPNFPDTLSLFSALSTVSPRANTLLSPKQSSSLLSPKPTFSPPHNLAWPPHRSSPQQKQGGWHPQRGMNLDQELSTHSRSRHDSEVQTGSQRQTGPDLQMVDQEFDMELEC